jgi:hypothetical protein
VVENLAFGGDVVFHRAEVVEVVFRDVANAGRACVETDVAFELQPRRFGDHYVAFLRFERVLRDRPADVAEHERMRPPFLNISPVSAVQWSSRSFPVMQTKSASHSDTQARFH